MSTLKGNSQLTAVLIGYGHGLAWALPHLLSEAGFTVDAITSSAFFQHHKNIRRCLPLKNNPANLLEILNLIKKENYTWIIPMEDTIISEIRCSDLSVEDKMYLLSLVHEHDLSHIQSKNNLTSLFLKHHIKTPPAFIATDISEAIIHAKNLGYPVLIKVDCSGGGAGVYECKTTADFLKINPQIFSEQVLVQKKIAGIELDLSALYFETQLTYFSYAIIRKTAERKFGPSSVRTYFPLTHIDQKIFDELKAIGKALSAHGFVTISCIEANDGSGRYYFEADKKPNAWFGYTRFIGEDPVDNIKNWFLHKKSFSLPYPVATTYPYGLTIPLFLRMNSLEICINRYNVLRFIPSYGKKLVIERIWRYLYYRLRVIISKTLRFLRLTAIIKKLIAHG